MLRFFSKFCQISTISMLVALSISCYLSYDDSGGSASANQSVDRFESRLIFLLGGKYRGVKRASCSNCIEYSPAWQELNNYKNLKKFLWNFNDIAAHSTIDRVFKFCAKILVLLVDDKKPAFEKTLSETAEEGNTPKTKWQYWQEVVCPSKYK